MDYLPTDTYSTVVGSLLQRLLRSRRRAVATHLGILGDTVGRLSRQEAETAAFRFHALYYRQFFLGRGGTRMLTSPSMTAARPGKGVLFLTAHIGPWDSAAKWILRATCRDRLFVVAKEQPLPFLTGAVRRIRQRFGAYDIWDQDPRQVAHECKRRLRDGELVVIFVDRDYWHSGSTAELFGEPTTLPIDLARSVAETHGVVVMAGAAKWASATTCRPHLLGEAEMRNSATRST